MRHEAEKVCRDVAGYVFPCACGCGKSVSVDKADMGLDFVFLHGGKKGSCRKRFMVWANDNNVTPKQLEDLFRWYRVNVIAPWTADQGAWNRSGFRKRTIEHGRKIEYADDPSVLPSWWRDFKYAPYLGQCGGDLAPEGYVYTHPFFLHLNFTPQNNPAEEGQSIGDDEAGKNGFLGACVSD